VLLIVGLVLTLAVTLGGSQAFPPEPAHPSADGGQVDDGGLLAWLRDGLEHVVGGGTGRPRADEISTGLARDEQPPPGRAWPEPKRVAELSAERSANSRVYELSDGRRQVELSMAPVHYRDAQGALQPIDTRVRPTTDHGYAQGNVTNTFTSLFGDRSDRLVRFERDGRAIGLGLIGEAKGITPYRQRSDGHVCRSGRRCRRDLRGHADRVEGEDRPFAAAQRGRLLHLRP
jgi:hypothetical protein